jgi:hypothetical protein
MTPFKKKTESARFLTLQPMFCDICLMCLRYDNGVLIHDPQGCARDGQKFVPQTVELQKLS